MEATRNQSCKDDSIGALDDEGDERHFIVMEQLNKETKRGTSGNQTENKMYHVERSKKSDERVKETDDHVHRPSDPLLTTSTKFTGI